MEFLLACFCWFVTSRQNMIDVEESWERGWVYKLPASIRHGLDTTETLKYRLLITYRLC